MSRKFLCLAALLALITAAVCPVLSFAADAENDESVIVVDASGKGKDRRAAMDSAFHDGIRQAAGMFIDSKTELEDGTLTEKIIDYSRGLIQRYEVIAEDGSGSLYEVTVRLWIVRDELRDGYQVATNKTAEVAFSMADLEPAKDEVKLTEAKERDAMAETSKAKAETGAELLKAMLARYKPEDFIDVKMVGRVTPVKNSDVEDLCQVQLEVSFNENYYYEKFVPDLEQVLDQISSRKKDVTLTKQRDTLRRIADKKGAPLADSSVILHGNELGKDFMLAVYDKPDRFRCRLYAFSKDDADKILNNQTGILAQFKGRIASIRSFQVELQDENSEIIDTAEQEITIPFLMTDSVIRDNIWAVHPTIMGFAGMYDFVPLYIENKYVTIPLRFEMPEEFSKLLTKVKATPIIDEGLAKAALDTRKACHESALTFFKNGYDANKAVFAQAADAGYPLAKVALSSIEAVKIHNTPNLLLEEYIDRLDPYVKEGNYKAIYNTFDRYERQFENFEVQKKCLPYLTTAAMVIPDAMIRMGEVQEQGFYGVKANKKRAETYYKEGIRLLSLLASQGMPTAAAQLGHVYIEGLGTKQDTPRAERYYQFAEKAGYNDPEFWFWKTFGVAMRVVTMPEQLVKNFTFHDETSYASLGNTSNEFFIRRRDFEGGFPGSTINPRTCFYLIREKAHAIYWHTDEGNLGVVNCPNMWLFYGFLYSRHGNKTPSSMSIVGFKQQKWDWVFEYRK